MDKMRLGRGYHIMRLGCGGVKQDKSYEAIGHQ